MTKRLFWKINSEQPFFLLISIYSSIFNQVNEVEWHIDTHFISLWGSLHICFWLSHSSQWWYLCCQLPYWFCYANLAKLNIISNHKIFIFIHVIRPILKLFNKLNKRYLFCTIIWMRFSGQTENNWRVVD